MERQVAAAFCHVADAGQPDDVGDLVRVDDRSRDAARDDRTRKMRGDAQAAFDMNVRVDQPGTTYAPLRSTTVLASIAGAQPGDPVARDGHVHRLDLAGKDVDDAPAAQQYIRRVIAPGDSQ